MKKFSVIFLIMLCIFSSAFAFAEGQYRWMYPQQIKTYVPPNHPNTIMMKHAFAEWTRLTNKLIIFKYTTSPNTAQLKVSFVKKIDTNKFQGHDRSVGLTSLTYTNSKITDATIYIADLTQDGHKLNRDEVYTVMLHEIGHSIGLNHSQDPKSVMFLGVNVIQEIESQDLKDVSKLYNSK